MFTTKALRVGAYSGEGAYYSEGAYLRKYGKSNRWIIVFFKNLLV